jgi:hypothetical protein
MNVRNIPSGPPEESAAPGLNAPQRAVLELLGGEQLQGSGFEHETPEPQFQFDWPADHDPKNQDRGGLR